MSEAAGLDGAQRELGDVVLINAYSYRNAGDAAIMISTRDLLVDLGAASVTLSSRYADGDAYSALNLPVIPEVVYFPQRGGGAKGAAGTLLTAAALAVATLAAAIGSIFPSAGRRLALLFLPGARGLSRFEALAIAGGGYMYSARRPINVSMWHSLVSIRLVQLFVPRTIMLPQSIGPVKRKVDASVIRWGLRRTHAVVRERLSLERSTVKVELASLETIDVAFYGMASPREDIEPIDGKRIVRVVVMDWTWSRSVAESQFDDYLRRVADICDMLAAEGFQVVLGGHSAIPEHGQDDIVAARAVQALAESCPEVDENCDVLHLARVYERCTAVVGSRLHSCIMALAVGTPAYALAYQEKSLGVLQRSTQLGLSGVAWVSEIDPAAVVSFVRDAAVDDREKWRAFAGAAREELRDFYGEYLRND